MKAQKRSSKTIDIVSFVWGGWVGGWVGGWGVCVRV